jgi:hypothetical protein
MLSGWVHNSILIYFMTVGVTDCTVDGRMTGE